MMRAMARVSIFAALAGATAGFMSAPAEAQLFWGGGYYPFSGVRRPPIVSTPAPYLLEGILTVGEVANMLREEGYRPLTRPVLNGDVYVAQVETADGARLRLVVHAYEGDIIERRLLGRGTPTARRPSTRNEQAALPPKPPLPPAPEGTVVPPVTPAPVERAPLAQPTAPAQEQAAVPANPAPQTTPPVAPPREQQTVTPPKPATPPRAARPRNENQAAVPPKTTAPEKPVVPVIPDNGAPKLETTEPPKNEQQARQQPRVILPNPADTSPKLNADAPPAQSLETQPSTPTPATPAVPPAPLN
ncbi:hypothetical protein [Terrarubrum flagellatum]|uniref:hypothetical protein n=1 Tax=Terrirubrum flagellatum TaxID=2895980 RepID=UPI0031455AA7